MLSDTRRTICAAALTLTTLAVAACGGADAPRAPRADRQDLIVQSTTSVRDSGVLEHLIKPRFERRYPQWNLKFIAVGSGEAIANARAGQADVLIAHSPKAEKAFVADGFSDEPTGRTVMWNDFVIVGPPDDPAGVRRLARHDAAAALEAIAAAGAAGRAHFVSRGDESGTNTKELDVWGLTDVRRNARNEPARGSRNPSWYRKAGLGMADTLRLTQQCPFGGGCYTITDRGTLQQLVSNGAISSLRIAMDRAGASARGGVGLMLNVYNVYAIAPAKFPETKLRGARAFMDFLTSAPFQKALEAFPSRRRPGFYAAATPRVTLTRDLPRTVPVGRTVTVTGRIVSPVPGAPAPSGLPVSLAAASTGAGPSPLARARAGSGGTFRLQARPRGAGELVLTAPRYGSLSALRVPIGRVTVP
jgi:tungstate transport system substrate-binding protein